jgi:hypothetical protein
MSQIAVRFRDAAVDSPASLSRAFIAITRCGSGDRRGPPERRLVNRSGADDMAIRYICQDIAKIAQNHRFEKGGFQAA